jgi:amphi-Trp domain-containing protein
MNQKRNLFKSKEKRTREEVSSFLRELADRISAGSIKLKHGEKEVNLDLSQHLTLEVKATEKQKLKNGLKYELELEIDWYENDQGQSDTPLQLG